VSSVPADVREESPFGSLVITSKREGAKLSIEGVMTLSRARIAAKDYPAFRAWLMQVDQQFGRKVVLQRQEPTASR
jgi:hypothetical protein